MILASFIIEDRFCGEILPVSTMISSGGRFITVFKKVACCSTRGLVGDRIITVPWYS
ncbi:MAG: hypothetical protein C00003105_00346 [ANME-2 cluster archaeon HR1]|nr:MAG: hypothetical protein C00003105_00346 [ANME-2 cluster archaeon HR1]